MKEFLKENIYIVYSVSCSMFFGIANYMVAVSMQKWRNSIVVLTPQFIPFFLIYTIYHYMQARKHTKPKYGSLWSRSTSVFYQYNPNS